jgi:hypothetical protein
VFLVLETNSNLYVNSTRAFTAFDNARKFVCYAGTALLNIVRVWKDRSKQHMADKKMKSILQMCFSGVKHDPQLKKSIMNEKGEGKCDASFKQCKM